METNSLGFFHLDTSHLHQLASGRILLETPVPRVPGAEVRQLLNKRLVFSPLNRNGTSLQASQYMSHRILRLHDIERDLVEADMLLRINKQFKLRNISVQLKGTKFQDIWKIQGSCKLNLTFSSPIVYVYLCLNLSSRSFPAPSIPKEIQLNIWMVLCPELIIIWALKGRPHQDKHVGTYVLSQCDF